jgi:hypothetical protein
VIKLASRRVAIVLAGSALALAGGLVPAQAATSGWRTDTTVAVRGNVTLLTSVTAGSEADAWAAGLTEKANGSAPPQGILRHWTGKAWRPVTLPAKIAREFARQDTFISEIGVASAHNVWAFGIAGGYLRLNGSSWSLGRLPGAGSVTSNTIVGIDAVKVFSSTNVWAFGERDSLSGTQEVAAPYAAHYNGSKWTRVTVPGNLAISAVSAPSSNQMWAVEGPLNGFAFGGSSTGTASPVVLHWTASTGWQEAAQQPQLRAGDQLISVVAEPNGDVWFGGWANNKAKGTTPLSAEWNGTTWSVKNLPMRATSADWQLGAMAPDGTGGIWAIAGNGAAARIWHLHGGTWSQVSPAFGKHRWILDALSTVPGTHSVWGVGAVIGSTRSSVNGLISVDGPLPR